MPQTSLQSAAASNQEFAVLKSCVSEMIVGLGGLLKNTPKEEGQGVIPAGFSCERRKAKKAHSPEHSGEIKGCLKNGKYSPSILAVRQSQGHVQMDSPPAYQSIYSEGSQHFHLAAKSTL